MRITTNIRPFVETLLVQKKWVTQNQLQALTSKTSTKNSLEEVLLSQKILNKKQLENLIQEARLTTALPFTSLPKVIPKNPILQPLPESTDFPHKIESPPPNKNKTFGNYQVIEELARGGMGIVYKAKHQQLGTIVALKIIIAGENASNEMIARFHREAKLTAKLQHPNIVQVFDSGEEKNLHYFVMEFIQGTTLEELFITEIPLKKGLSLFVKILEALHYAHQQGIIHRDLKPANIFINKEGEPKIGDFGLARSTDASSQKLTKTGQVMGSPSYMPPEQISGEGKLIATADIYAIGVCLYQFLTHRFPFEANTVHDLFYKIVSEDAVNPSKFNPKIHKDLDTIILKTLAKESKNRYQTAIELASDLERFLEGCPIQAKPTTNRVQFIKWVRRNQTSILLSTFLLSIILASIFFSQWQNFQNKKQQKTNILKKVQKEITLAKQQNTDNKKARNSKIKHLLIAADTLKQLLYPSFNLPEVEQEYFKINTNIIELACQNEEYGLALFIARELKTILSTPEKAESLSQWITDQKNKTKIQNLEKLGIWIVNLRKKPFDQELHKDAIFSISKMKEKEVLQRLLKLLDESQQYFEKTSRIPSQTQLYFTLIKILSRLQKPTISPILFQHLNYFYNKTKELKENEIALDELNMMVLLTQALGIQNATEYNKKIDEIQKKMGDDSIYSNRTKKTFYKLLEIELAEKEKQNQKIDYVQRGFLRYEQKNYQGALEDIEQAIQIEPKKSSLYNQRGLIKHKLKKYQAALTDYDIAISLTPSEINYLNRALTKSLLKDHQGAIEDYNKAIKLNPKAFRVYSNRGNVKKELKDFRGAISDYTQALEFNPAFTLAHTNRGQTYYLLKNFPKALQDFNEAIRLNSQNSTAYNYRGLVLREQGKLQNSIKDFNKAINLNPTNYLYYMNRANTKHRLGDWEGAIRDFSESIRIAPNFAQAYYNRGLVKRIKKDFNGSLADLNTAIKLNTESSLAFTNRGIVKEILKKYNEALKDYNRAIAINPKEFSALLKRGLLKLQILKDYTGALIDLNDALKLKPNSIDAIYSKAWVYSSQNKREKAIQYLEPLRKKSPQLENLLVEFILELGLKSYQLQEYQKALQLLQKYKKYAPKNHSFQSKVDEILYQLSRKKFKKE